MRSVFILRVIVYSGLLCLILLTVQLLVSQRPAEEPERIRTEARGSDVSQAAPPVSPFQNSSADSAPPFSSSKVPAISVDEQAMQPVQAKSELAKKAWEKFREGDYEGALRLFNELSEQDKGAFTGAGISCFKLGDYTGAVNFLSKAVDSDSKNFAALKFLALAYYKLDSLDKSSEHAGKALAIRSDSELRTLSDRLAKERRAQRDYIEESTSHFKILYDGYEHGRIDREISGILEDAYRSIGREFNFFPDDSVTVILYTGKDFYDTTQAPDWSGGIYDGKIRIPVRGAEGRTVVLKKVLFHEYTHVVVQSLARQCPRWIDEGLAEYFSAGYHRRTNQIIPLRSLEGSFFRFSGGDITLAYEESYSAVLSLIENFGLYRVKEMLLVLSKDADLNRAFKESFGTSYDDFVSEWGR